MDRYSYPTKAEAEAIQSVVKRHLTPGRSISPVEAQPGGGWAFTITVEPIQHRDDDMPPRVKRLWEILQGGEAFTVAELSQKLGNISSGAVRTRLTLLHQLMPIEAFGEHGQTRYRIKHLPDNT